jgi:hypothetical protein
MALSIDLSGRVALVTGARGQLGLAMAPIPWRISIWSGAASSGRCHHQRR